MGGDHGIETMLPGCAIALERWPALTFDLVGDDAQLSAALDRFPAVKAVSAIIHAPEVVAGAERPSQAIRRSKTTSMGIAIDRVKQGVSGAAVSAGNTGALMAMAKLALRTMPGIDRPALAALLPSLGEKDFVMLDLGANTECETRNLVEFAIMGAAYSRTALGIERPRVALLNIGTEDQKGTDEIRDAADLLRASKHLHLNFQGFIEGDRISRGESDVVVCDGFTGNISLKTMEGTARFVTDLLRRAFTSSIRSKFGFLISRPATELLKHHLDPNNHNGAVFLGLNGVVVKSHGSATDKGVANAIAVAGRLVADRLTSRIAEDLALIKANGA
jgi:glycerol-3-phosphate acyltransferase PlsX